MTAFFGKKQRDVGGEGHVCGEVKTTNLRPDRSTNTIGCDYDGTRGKPRYICRQG